MVLIKCSQDNKLPLSLFNSYFNIKLIDLASLTYLKN